jgi:hypothetical protein
MVPGGLSEARPATPEIQEIADKVSGCISEKKVDPKSGFIVWHYVKGVGKYENQSTRKCGFVQVFGGLKTEYGPIQMKPQIIPTLKE